MAGKNEPPKVLTLKLQLQTIITMKTHLLLLSLFLLNAFMANSQNGKIVEQKAYVFADSIIAKIGKTLPNAKSQADNIDFYQITYLSDGLKVTGVMAIPEKAGKYPCVIVNRGGNRESGAWHDFTVMRFFGEVASWGYVVVGSQYRGNAGSEGKEEFGDG